MKVIATKKGYDGIVVREPGDEFDMKDGSKGSWFEPVKVEAKAEEPRGKTGKTGKKSDESVV